MSLLILNLKLFHNFFLYSSGLGDSNYSNFCRCARDLDNILLGLGAKPFTPTGFADDGVGYVFLAFTLSFFLLKKEDIVIIL